MVAAAKRRTHSARIVARIARLDEFDKASTVMVYWPMTSRGEVDIRPLITLALRAGKQVCFPRVDWTRRRLIPALVTSIRRDLEVDPARPKLGLRQPRADCPSIPAKRLDLILVPGVAFDKRGGRLGRGGGFYDRFLTSLPRPGPILLAAAFAPQIVDRIPMEPHDQPVEIIVTPGRVFRCGRKRR